MLYDTYMRKAVEAAVVNEDGHIYLKPEYKRILRDEGLYPEKVTDTKIDMEEVSEYLKLEVERLKEIGTKREIIYEWLYDIINTSIDPALTDQENEMFKNMLDYLKLNADLNQREQEVINKEEQLAAKEEAPLELGGFNFAKKKPGT